MKSKIINFVAGPSIGKSIFTSLIFADIKMRGYSSEIVPEFAKKLVWAKEFELLNNQYFVSNQQYKDIKAVNGHIPYIVTDGSLLHGLVYNRNNPENTSNIEKTEKAILKWYSEFNNIVFFLERNPDVKYEQEGRIQTEEEAIQIDFLLKDILKEFNIPFISMKSDVSLVSKISDIILNN